MPPTLDHHSQPAVGGFSPSQCHVVLAQARALQLAAESGQPQPLLRGKNLGLLCEAGDDLDLGVLRHAAAELGAQVAHLRPSLSKLSTPEDIQQTAHLLGRLYDAVVCQGVPAALVVQLGNDAGVPVYDGIASPWHPIHRLAEQLGDKLPVADRRRLILQAVLLASMA